MENFYSMKPHQFIVEETSSWRAKEDCDPCGRPEGAKDLRYGPLIRGERGVIAARNCLFCTVQVVLGLTSPGDGLINGWHYAPKGRIETSPF
jgi:hypothetical protein